MLADLQKNFLQAMRGEIREDLLTYIKASAHISPSERLEIYRNNILANAAQALAITFVVTQAIVGIEFFRAMARRYVAENFPASSTLNRYGKSFPDFIAHFEPAASLPYLSDVARFDWLYHEAAHAPRDIAIAPQLAGETPLSFRASVGLFSSPYPITRIRQLTQDKSSEKLILEGACYVILHRPHQVVEIEELRAEEYAILSRFSETGEIDETTAELAVALFARLLQREVFAPSKQFLSSVAREKSAVS